MFIDTVGQHHAKFWFTVPMSVTLAQPIRDWTLLIPVWCLSWYETYLIPKPVRNKTFHMEPIWYWNYLIPNLTNARPSWYWTVSATKPDRYRIYQMQNVSDNQNFSDTKPIRYRTSQIPNLSVPNLSENKPIRHQTYLIRNLTFVPNLSGTRPIWYGTSLISNLSVIVPDNKPLSVTKSKTALCERGDLSVSPQSHSPCSNQSRKFQPKTLNPTTLCNKLGDKIRGSQSSLTLPALDDHQLLTGNFGWIGSIPPPPPFSDDSGSVPSTLCIQWQV
jgi:hypothetical protein